MDGRSSYCQQYTFKHEPWLKHESLWSSMGGPDRHNDAPLRLLITNPYRSLSLYLVIRWTLS